MKQYFNYYNETIKTRMEQYFNYYNETIKTTFS
jgi:hypothetical protein